MPLVIHGVQHLFHTPVWLDEWPDENQKTRLVFITNGIERKTLETYFGSWIASYKGGFR
jgi:G3E family GTPase